MWDVVKAMLRLLWRRHSESAAVLAITVSQFMDDKDLRNMAVYYRVLRELRERREAE